MIAQIRNKLLFLFVALCPIFYYSQSGDMRETQSKFFQFAALCVIASFIENIWLMLFFFWNVFSFFWNGGVIGLNQVLNIFLGCMLFQCSKSYFRKNEFKPFVYIIIAVGLFSCLFMILQLFHIDPLIMGKAADGEFILNHYNYEPVGLFYIKMANGIFLSFLLPLVASFNPILAIFLFIPIGLCKASFAILAGFLALLFYYFYNNRKLFLILLILGTIGVGIFFVLDQKGDAKTFKSRFTMWHAVAHYAMINPIGYGPDSFRNLSTKKNFQFVSDHEYKSGIAKYEGDGIHPKYYEPGIGITTPMEFWQYVDPIDKKNKFEINNWDNPHNEYLNLFFQYGYIGVIIFIGFFRDLWIKFHNSSKSKEITMLVSILIIYFVSAIGHFTLEIARLGCLFPIILGALEARMVPKSQDLE